MAFARRYGCWAAMILIAGGVLVAEAAADGDKAKRDAAAVFDGGEAEVEERPPSADVDSEASPTDQLKKPEVELPPRAERNTPKPDVAEVAEKVDNDTADRAEGDAEADRRRPITPVFIMPTRYEPIMPEDPPAARWEYSRLREALTVRDDVPTYSLVLASKEKQIVANGWSDLSRKLNGERGDDQLAVLDALGNAGWELAALEVENKPNAKVKTYLFKRQVRDRRER